MARQRFRLKCPQCGGYYYVEVIENYEFETCPFGCGYSGDFKGFVEYEVEPMR